MQSELARRMAEKEVSMHKYWQYLPPMISNRIVDEWEVKKMLDDIFRDSPETHRISHRCERALYPVSKGLEQAWGDGRVFKTPCGACYGCCYFTHHKTEGSRLAVFMLGRDEKKALTVIKDVQDKKIITLRDLTGIWYKTSLFRL